MTKMSDVLKAVNYMDEIAIIRLDKMSPLGISVDRVFIVYFVRFEDDGRFSYLHTRDLVECNMISYGDVSQIAAVNGVSV